MVSLPRLGDVRTLGGSTVNHGIEMFRAQLRQRVRRSMGITEEPASACSDPELAYFPPGSITRRVNGDFASMLVGGLGALLLQMLHPRAIAGVADHSDFRVDPLGRLDRTASFLGTTTFGRRDEALSAIGRVRAVHDHVVGTTADGTPYAASDPDLLTWVHAAETRCFLSASLTYGVVPLLPADQDRYLDEMARVAIDLGARSVPRSMAELDDYFAGIRPDLALTPEAASARNFILLGPSRWPHEATAYGLLLAAAQGILPGWARRTLGLISVPGVDALAVRPAARALTVALRWVVAPPAQG